MAENKKTNKTATTTPATAPEAKIYLTILEAAETLKVHPKIIYALCKLLDFPAAKVGGRWRIRQDLMNKWWEEQWEQKSVFYR